MNGAGKAKCQYQWESHGSLFLSVNLATELGAAVKVGLIISLSLSP